MEAGTLEACINTLVSVNQQGIYVGPCRVKSDLCQLESGQVCVSLHISLCHAMSCSVPLHDMV